MRPTRRSLVLAAVAAASLLPASSAVAHDDSGSSRHRAHDLLRAPIAGSLTTDRPIFGATPGGAPWVIDRGSARVRRDGRIEVRVEGLIIPRGDNTNPVPRLSATLVCNGKLAANSSMTTRTVPFSRSGDARIRDYVKVPKRCIAPVVLLNPNGIRNVFIGITGVEE
jgi:hypothetical protein